MIDPVYSGLLTNVERYVSLTEAEQNHLCAIATIAHLPKNSFIDEPGKISAYRNYIVKGAFRSYYIDEQGKEHTVQLALEDWFVSDFYSYITQSPATLYVEALEDATLLQLPYQSIESLCSEIHALSEYFRVSTEKAFAFSRKRALTQLSMTAEERYLELIKRYPAMGQRIPQKIIASYLGFTPEFMSKIKARLAKKG